MVKVPGYPEAGMYFKMAREHARRFAATGQFNTVNALLNQVRAHDGEKAARELAEEIQRDFAPQMRNGS